jgi:RNA polymerase subunit RPABC4/transcription elongation factor Spt4
MPDSRQEKVQRMNENDENIRAPQPDRWNLTAPEIAGMLRRTGVTPRRGSPFLRLHGEGTVSPPDAAIEDTPEIREATARIGRPDIILGLLHVPPGEPDVSWFYGAEGDRRFAVHRRDGGMWHRIVWPVRDTTLADLMETAVSIHEPAVTDGFALILDRRGFEALAVVVDFLQEETLRSAMNRRLPSVLQFDVDDLFCCYQRNLRGIDLRWMVQRSKLISPVRLGPDPEGLRSGLGSLVRQGMLVQEGTLYASTARFSTACSLLAGCSGFFALSTRRRMGRGDGEDAWDFQHMAAMRAIGSLWLLEFSDISGSDFTLKLGDVTASLLHERVAAGLLPPERAPVPSDEAAETEALCQNCGSLLQPPAKFCPNCGARIVEMAALAAESEAAPELPHPEPATPAGAEASGIPCPKCGAVIASSKKFCTRCGASLR